MKKIKRFSKVLLDLLKSLIKSGDISMANEVTANIMVGAVALMMALLMGGAWILNSVGIFTADPKLMRLSAIISISISIFLTVINRVFSGKGKWIKYVLEIGLIFECGAMVGILGHNVALVTLIPAIISIRYFDEKFSARVCLISAIAFFLSTITCAQYGILNLNVLPVENGTVITVTGNLHKVFEEMGIDRTAYVWSYLQNDYLPRFLIFSVVAIICCQTAKRGRQMLELQNEITTKNSRIETELNLATEIQSNMLPCTLPAFPAHQQLELFAKNIPAKEVGGDFYDYFVVDPDHVAIVIADVSGKGIGAALFMMISKTMIKNQLQLGIGPAQAMMNVNTQLCENNTAGLFVTVWAAVYEVSTGTLRYVNAGHNPPIIKKKGQACYYHKSASGFVLAGLSDIVYKESEINLSEGDEIFLYTDGVTEATDKYTEMFGEDRLLNLLEENKGETVEEQVGDILAEIKKFVGDEPQFDDITMLGVKIHAPESTEEK